MNRTFARDRGMSRLHPSAPLAQTRGSRAETHSSSERRAAVMAFPIVARACLSQQKDPVLGWIRAEESLAFCGPRSHSGNEGLLLSDRRPGRAVTDACIQGQVEKGP
ncbi:hypothetical protein AAFF_G00104310 [Aldrovandia affinis]|uniref:Uncharacterized protein n=1 Tax=Aldrovandia affinis TaxID=143900 RepID=A0AAD7T1V0_9TELE|nr:hypothetical protein AAFF_G00104310 [Aldrovandia affinis]